MSDRLQKDRVKFVWDASGASPVPAEQCPHTDDYGSTFLHGNPCFLCDAPAQPTKGDPE